MSLLSWLGLQCGHARTTFPITPVLRRGVKGLPAGPTYVVCLDCGKEFEFELGKKLGQELQRGETASAKGRTKTVEA